MQLKSIKYTPDNDLNSQLNTTKSALEKLKDTPEFLDTQEIVSATQAQLIKQFNIAKATV